MTMRTAMREAFILGPIAGTALAVIRTMHQSQPCLAMRHAFAATGISMLATLFILAATLSADDMAGVTTPTEELKVLAMAAEGDCRGYYPTDARMFAGCAARDIYQDILESRGICNAGPFIEEDNWETCR